MSAFGHETERVKPFVSTHRDRLRLRNLFQRRQQRIAFRCPVGLKQLYIDDQSVAILHQQIPTATQPGLLPLAFARHPWLRIGPRFVRII
jgi:hypothetical protein